MINIYLGSDHAGFALKNSVKAYLLARDGIDHVIDVGPHLYDAQDDYPDLIYPVARAVARNRPTQEGQSYGIIFGASGQGEAIVANRVPGVRAVVYYGGNEEVLSLSKEHNDANILSLGARFLSKEEGIRAVEVWLHASFSGDERHRRRIQKIDDTTSHA